MLVNRKAIVVITRASNQHAGTGKKYFGAEIFVPSIHLVKKGGNVTVDVPRLYSGLILCSVKPHDASRSLLLIRQSDVSVFWESVSSRPGE